MIRDVIERPLPEPTTPSPNENPSKNWVFTLNNYTESQFGELSALEGNDQVHYLAAGREVGGQGTPHLQGKFLLTRFHPIQATKKICRG